MSTIYVDKIENKTSGTPVLITNASDQTLTGMTVESGKNSLVIGPVTVTTVTVNGNLQCVGNLNFTTSMTIASGGSVNVI